MNSFIIFFKKEIIELIKTVKGIVLAAVFIMTAISSPLIAKLTPEILKLAGIDGSAEEFQALMAMIPEPSSLESYTQFFSNFSMMGFLAFIIIFAGIVANEKSKTTAAYILTKNISRTQFIASKFAAAVVFTAVAVFITAATQIFYTNILFSDNLVNNADAVIYFAVLLVYLLFILSIVLFASIVSKNVTTATFTGFLIFIGFNIIAAIPRIGKYLPPEINNLGFMIIMQTKTVSDLTINLIITVICSAIFIFAGIKLFNRQEL